MNPAGPADALARARKAGPRRAEIPKSSDSLDAYLKDIRDSKSLSLEEEQALAARIQAGDNKALNSLVEANLKFVVSVCRNYQHQGLSMGDLINEGNLGLIRAARRFDAGLNCKFISYAVWWIRQGILTALAEQVRPVKLTPGRAGVIQKIGKANRRLEQKLGRSPSLEEVAEELQVLPLEVTECLQLASAPLSLNRPVLEDGGTLEEVLEDSGGEGTDREALLGLLGKNIDQMLGTLDEREEGVLRRFFGIGRGSAESYEEISAEMGLTAERVRQIKVKAIERLRHPSRIARLDGFKQ